MQENNKRILLDGCILLNEKNDYSNKHEVYIIEPNENSNSQCLKYNCFFENELGILTEFYPENFTSIRRNMKTGTLCLYKDQKEFVDKQQNYLSQITKLQKLANDIPEFKEFIPKLKILESPRISSNDGTLYLWQEEIESIQIYESFANELIDKKLQLKDLISAFAGLIRNLIVAKRAGIYIENINPQNVVFPAKSGMKKFNILQILNLDINMSTTDDIENLKNIGQLFEYALFGENKIKNHENRMEILFNLENSMTTSHINNDLIIESLVDILAYGGSVGSKQSYENMLELLERCITLFNDKSDQNDFVDNYNEKILYHLYKYPLYEFSYTDKLNVVICGFNKSSQVFLNYCLMLGQMKDKKLNVTIINGDKKDFETYIADRPMLKQFFSINKKDEKYGNINFKENKKGNAVFDYDQLKDEFGSKAKPDYIFIDSKDDEQCKNIAQKALSLSKETGKECSINYLIREKNNLPIEFHVTCYNEQLSELIEYKEILRMAFNVHLCWQKNLHLSLEDIKKEFNTSYNKNTSITNVVSIKYKLHDMGIELEDDFNETAEKAWDYMKNNKDAVDVLISQEHRRWVVEKICDGWTKMDIDTCIERQETKNKKAKKHICLVDSNHKEKKDELYMLSKDLQKKYMAKATEVFGDIEFNLLMEQAIYIRESNDEEVLEAYNEWNYIINEIATRFTDKITNNNKIVFKYESAKNNFYETLIKSNKITNYIKSSIRNKMKTFETSFYYVLEAMKSTDWREKDAIMVKNIPFILTYSSELYIVVPLDNYDARSNILAATVGNPKKILYVAQYGDAKKIIKMMSCMTKFFENRNIYSEIELILLGGDKNPYSDFHIKEMNIKESNIKCLYSHEENEAELLISYLERRVKARKDKPVIFEKNNTRISGIIETAFSEKINMYSIGNDYTIKEEIGRFLSYIPHENFMLIKDMLTLAGAEGVIEEQPELQKNYKELYSRYIKEKERNSYKKLVRGLQEIVKLQNIIYTPKYEKKRNKTVLYTIPLKYIKGARKLLDILKTTQEIDKDKSKIFLHSTSACCVEIVGISERQKSYYDKFFTDYYLLDNPDRIQYEENKKHKKHIIFDGLFVDKHRKYFEEDDDKNENESYIEAFDKIVENKNELYFLEKKGLINNLSITNDHIKFNFATYDVKKLLTITGQMLEIYVYHKLKSTGYFDDIANGVEMYKNDIKNEMDIVLTKGFRSVFIECKSTNVGVEFYYKLYCVNDTYGVDVPVLIQVDSKKGNNKLKESIIRGKSYNITTIDYNNIQNIDKTIIKILESI